MRVALATAYSDSGAAALGWRLGLPPLDALVVHHVPVGAWTVEVRLLGASHQVRVLRQGRCACSEAVACLPGAAPLPPGAARLLPDGRYSFTALTRHPDPDGFARTVCAIDAAAGRDPQGTALGRYPGHPDALTAVTVRRGPAGAVTWQTWHTYPQTLEVVVTESHLQPAEP